MRVASAVVHQVGRQLLRSVTALYDIARVKPDS